MLALLSLSPVLLLAMIGLIGRSQTLAWEFEEYSPREVHILRSYRQAGLQTLVLQENYLERTPENVAEMLDAWLKAKRDAGTSSLPMVSLADQGQAGAKFSLMNAKGLAAHMGLHLAAHQAEAGETETAMQTYLQIMEIAQIGRDSGFNCMIDSCRDTLPAISGLAAIAHQLDPASRQMVIARLDAFELDEEMTTVILERMNRLDRRSRVIESPELGVIVAHASDGQTDSSEETANEKRLIFEAGRQDPTIAPLAKMAKVHQESLRKRLNSLYDLLLNP